MNSGPTIKLPSTGGDVKRLQRILVMIKSLGPDQIDGIFGPKTKKAVRAYQTARSLPVTGIVDDLTWWSPAGAAGVTLASSPAS